MASMVHKNTFFMSAFDLLSCNHRIQQTRMRVNVRPASHEALFVELVCVCVST